MVNIFIGIIIGGVIMLCLGIWVINTKIGPKL